MLCLVWLQGCFAAVTVGIGRGVGRFAGPDWAREARAAGSSTAAPATAATAAGAAAAAAGLATGMAGVWAGVVRRPRRGTRAALAGRLAGTGAPGMRLGAARVGSLARQMAGRGTQAPRMVLRTLRLLLRALLLTPLRGAGCLRPNCNGNTGKHKAGMSITCGKGCRRERSVSGHGVARGASNPILCLKQGCVACCVPEAA